MAARRQIDSQSPVSTSLAIAMATSGAAQVIPQPAATSRAGERSSREKIMGQLKPPRVLVRSTSADRPGKIYASRENCPPSKSRTGRRTRTGGLVRAQKRGLTDRWSERQEVGAERKLSGRKVQAAEEINDWQARRKMAAARRLVENQFAILGVRTLKGRVVSRAKLQPRPKLKNVRLAHLFRERRIGGMAWRHRIFYQGE